MRGHKAILFGTEQIPYTQKRALGQSKGAKGVPLPQVSSVIDLL